jgi:peptidoglycan/LPS O-acetylase OafA/YrhL
LVYLQRVPATWMLLGYVAFTGIAAWAGLRLGNTVSLAVYLPLTLLVIRVAFSGLGRVAALLRKNDISYGVYIYHMPLVNQLLFFERSGGGMVLAAIAGSVLAAALSWFLIEKPSLRLKRHPMHSVTS